MSEFDGCKRRIYRAFDHLKAFAAGSRTIFRDNEPKVAFRLKHNGALSGSGTASLTFDNAAIHDLSLEIGELFYQLRSALDGAFWEAAVIVSKPDKPAKQSRIEFPICDRRKFKQSQLHSLSFPQDFRDWVESIQPYNAAATDSKVYAGINSALSTIHDCARLDRHRHLHVVGLIACGAAGRFTCHPPCSISYTQPLPVDFSAGETDFLRFGIEGWDGLGDPDIFLDGHIDTVIALYEVPVPMGGDLGEELQRLIQAAAFVVSSLEQRFGTKVVAGF